MTTSSAPPANLTGRIFNLQKYSIQDGPGIRTTVFLKGCPLACAWCHNPEGLSPQREFMVLEGRCTVCGLCREACPQPVSRHGVGPLPPRQEGCTFCAACVDACPAGARQWAGEDVTVSQLVTRLLSDRLFFEDSGGGVTFSGGEPLVQFDFLHAALTACRAQELHTVVDTSGYCAREKLLAIAPLTRLFLFDLKTLDPARHQHFTGADNRLVRENLEALAGAGVAIWLRIPLVAGVNDTEAEWEAMACLAARLPAIRQVNLLPYHKIGLQKYGRLGYNEPVTGFPPVSPEVCERAAAVFRRQGLAVRIGG